jgi:phosphoketolase
MMYVTGPGHGGPAIVANTYLEGTYSEIEPKQYIARHGRDMPDVRNWRWGSKSDTASRASGPDTAADF